jgi:hypothetical protein
VRRSRDVHALVPADELAAAAKFSTEPGVGDVEELLHENRGTEQAQLPSPKASEIETVELLEVTQKGRPVRVDQLAEPTASPSAPAYSSASGTIHETWAGKSP